MLKYSLVKNELPQILKIIRVGVDWVILEIIVAVS